MMMGSRATARWMRVIPVIALCSVIVGCASERSGALIVDENPANEADYEYLIPLGTAERIREGEAITILPAELAVHVGEVIKITNEDSEGHFIGIFYVGPHEEVAQRFASEGEFIGNCTVHPSGQITLRVSE